MLEIKTPADLELIPSHVQTIQNARSNSYTIDMCNNQVNEVRRLKKSDPQTLIYAAIELGNKWLAQADKLKNQLGNQNKAKSISEEAAKNSADLANVLNATLSVNDAIDFESLKDRRPFPTPKPTYTTPALTLLPAPPVYVEPRIGILDIIFNKRKQKKIDLAQRQHSYNLECHRKKYNEVKQRNESLLATSKSEYNKQVLIWENNKAKWIETQNEHNKQFDKLKADFYKGDPQTVNLYYQKVLDFSTYPDCLPQMENEVIYNPDNRIVLINKQLPKVTDLPTIKAAKYVQSKDEITYSSYTPKEIDSTYDELLYQICLRTIHEIVESDVINAIDAIFFNGYVRHAEATTGKEINPCVMTVNVQKKDFIHINLAAVDPKKCFKNLKGVACAQLSGLAPVAPLLTFNKNDKRFIDARQVARNLDESVNLASMPWEDFEHLVREIFEKEFAANGGECKVTQASRDGGVDAIVYDPDPIRGGTIVIQAKRYTNTVGVSAIRELYGTVGSEGANKGIIVTTSDYGPDAYEFAKGKPLTLLNGQHLLYMLEKHGHKAKIDIAEARSKQPV